MQKLRKAAHWADDATERVAGSTQLNAAAMVKMREIRRNPKVTGLGTWQSR